MAHELAPLPYPKEALEPFIDAATMEIHHGRHHKAYVDNLNKAITGHEALEKMSLEHLIGDVSALPEAVRGKSAQVRLSNDGQDKLLIEALKT